MIIKIRPNAPQGVIAEVTATLEQVGAHYHRTQFGGQPVFVAENISESIRNSLAKMSDVAALVEIFDPYPLCSANIRPEGSVIRIRDFAIGQGNFAIIAGPCTVETEKQVLEAAQRVKAAGATALRGGAFKPRTSPYAFQGLRGCVAI